MAIRSHVFTEVFVALLLVSVHHSGAQIGGRMTVADILAVLKPGQWVELEGSVRPGLSIICTEVKLLTGDLLNDDWEITGTVRRVDQHKQEVEILHILITVKPDAEFKDDDGKLKSFADLKRDAYMQAEGTYLKDGTFLAKEIENKSDKLKKKPELKNKIVVRGKMETIDPTKRTITLMGMTFQLTDSTQGRSAIR